MVGLPAGIPSARYFRSFAFPTVAFISHSIGRMKIGTFGKPSTG